MRLMLYVDDEPGGVLFCVDFVGMFAVFEANNKLGLSFECAAGTHFWTLPAYAGTGLRFGSSRPTSNGMATFLMYRLVHGRHHI